MKDFLLRVFVPSWRYSVSSWLSVAAAAAALGSFVSGCATLGAIVQPPRLEQAPDRQAEIRLLSPSATHPLGGAGIRVWAKVTNPNPFGFTLSTLSTTLLLEGTRAATGDFPLGLPLAAGQDTVIPLDLSISFSDLPGLADAIRRAAGGGGVQYQLDGSMGVDAGRLGKPTFGPMLLMRGELHPPGRQR